MPLTGHLKIGDIQGESRSAEHEEEIDIHAMQWSVAQSSGSGGSRRRSRAEVDDLVLHKYYDASSPYLFIGCKRGKVFPEAIVSVEKLAGDGRRLDYLVITMTNVMINSVEIVNDDTSANELIHEVITLSCEKAKTTFAELNDDGSVKERHEIAFNVIAPN